MSDDGLQIYTKTPEKVVDALETALAAAYGGVGWQRRSDAPEQALMQLFARLAEIMANRLNQTPEQHLLAFLNEAELEPLPPLAAQTELTFTPAADSLAPIQAPACTQVATKPAPGRPEIIFETEEDLLVVPAELVACVALEPTRLRDCTRRAQGVEPGLFDPFTGEQARERSLYLGHDTLFAFADDASRALGALLLDFSVEPPVNPPPGPLPATWRIAWAAYDAAAQAWREVAQTDVPSTPTAMPGGVLDARLERLPPVEPSELHGQKSCWLRATLLDAAPPFLPTLTLRRIRQVVQIDAMRPVKVDASLAGVQGGEVFTPLDTASPFLPLGRTPAPMDAFYVRIDEAFKKPGATVQIDLELSGLPAELKDPSRLAQLKIQWEYGSDKGWQPLGSSTCPCPGLVNLRDETRGLTKPLLERYLFSLPRLEFYVPDGYAASLPAVFTQAVKTPDRQRGGMRYFVRISAACADQVDAIWDETSYQSDLPDDPKRTNDPNRPDFAALPNHHSFRDTTCALTTSGIVAFKVPSAAQGLQAFAPTVVAGQAGYWVRARLLAGGYEEPVRLGWLGRLSLGQDAALPPKLYPPAVQSLDVSYGAYERTRPEPLAGQALWGGDDWAGTHCWSKTDHAYWRDHLPDLRDNRAFAPFSAAEQEPGVEHAPGLYLAFAPVNRAGLGPAFPPGVWVQLHVDAAEPVGPGGGPAPTHTPDPGEALTWEIWSGQQWLPLRVVDGSAGLTQRGYVRFLAPPLDPLPSLPASAEERPPLDRALDTTLEAGAPLRALTWLRVCRVPAPGGAATTLQVAALRLNTVPARNAETIRGEILGSSNGEPHQQFSVARRPVLLDAGQIRLEVREADRPAANGESGGQWLPWTLVESLTGQDAESRVFLLDPVAGVVRFGDGSRGHIPPPGLSNLRISYRVHAGAGGATPAQQITALRTPSGGLSKVQAVVNHADAGGGRGEEELEPFKARGRQVLRHRHRAVTLEDFQWLAQEVSGVARAYCLPLTRGDGARQTGQVALIVVPKPSDAIHAPGAAWAPTPALLRRVQAHLQQHALTSLGAATHAARRIHVRGPDYLEIQVEAELVPTDPAAAGATRRAALDCLDAFLQPLGGGPDRTGWEAGRDVYVSEVAHELAGLPSVDHVAKLSVTAPSLQQQQFTLTLSGLPWELPAGSQVSTFDERVKLVLAESLLVDQTRNQTRNQPTVYRIVVYGLKVGDRVELIQPDQRPLPGGPWTVVGLRPSPTGSPNVNRAAGLDKPMVVLDKLLPPAAHNLSLALLAPERRIRLPVHSLSVTGTPAVTTLETGGFSAGDRVSLVHRDQRSRSLHDLPPKSFDPSTPLDRIFVPPGHLVYSGQHKITMSL